MSVLAFNQFSTNVLTATLRMRSFYHPAEVVDTFALETTLLTPEHPYTDVRQPFIDVAHTLGKVHKGEDYPRLRQVFPESLRYLQTQHPNLTTAIEPIVGLFGGRPEITELAQALQLSMGRLREVAPVGAAEVEANFEAVEHHLGLIQLSLAQYVSSDEVLLRAPDDELIMLVDDDPSISRLMQRFLSREGYRHVLFHDPREAVAHMNSAEGERITAILTDNDMPGMGGREMVVEIRRSHPDIPVLMQSGGFEGYGPIDSLTAFLEKPYGHRELLAKVESWLSSAQLLLADNSRG